LLAARQAVTASAALDRVGAATWGGYVEELMPIVQVPPVAGVVAVIFAFPVAPLIMRAAGVPTITLGVIAAVVNPMVIGRSERRSTPQRRNRNRGG
jgi:hypothetical protein